jgi:hypothetical protein
MCGDGVILGGEGTMGRVEERGPSCTVELITPSTPYRTL